MPRVVRLDHVVLYVRAEPCWGPKRAVSRIPGRRRRHVDDVSAFGVQRGGVRREADAPFRRPRTRCAASRAEPVVTGMVSIIRGRSGRHAMIRAPGRRVASARGAEFRPSEAPWFPPRACFTIRTPPRPRRAIPGCAPGMEDEAAVASAELQGRSPNRGARALRAVPRCLLARARRPRGVPGRVRPDPDRGRLPRRPDTGGAGGLGARHRRGVDHPRGGQPVGGQLGRLPRPDVHHGHPAPARVRGAAPHYLPKIASASCGCRRSG